MLKALELVGFKSFPDKTRFEFPPGITVVVGPNGSGKSNIVDAMKWVLGEQSARSLRGKEMADVIFKGSAQGQRKPANTAQVTMIFDNTSKLLPNDAVEVHVTRRVYRSGEGEYLINGDVCRLRDIKDMFRGTGLGSDAYSLIEQGKVDSLLRASPKDRRAIFEEAAGISRFKAKKVDAQRRLERVEQNMLRLSDIVDEVHTRWNRIKSQASKAQRYREHSERLQSLRTHVGRSDWQRFTSELAGLESESKSLAAEMASAAAELEAHEFELRESETQVSDIQQSARKIDAKAGRARERRAGCESIVAQQNATVTQLQQESERHAARSAELRSRAAALEAQLSESQLARNSAQQTACNEQNALKASRDARDQLVTQIQTARTESETKREQFVLQMRQAADLGNHISAHESQQKSADAAIAAAESRREAVQQELVDARANLEECEANARTAKQQMEEVDAEFKSLQSQLSAEESEYAQGVKRVAQLRQRHAALLARVSVMEEIEQRMEGVGSGVKQVLDLSSKGDPVFAGVRGMVADIVDVTDPDKALMVEIALGQRAEHLVVAGQELFEQLEGGCIEFPGRVGFLRLQSSPPPSSAVVVNLDGEPGVIGRADRFVQTDSEYEHLVGWLMRDTWFVESITDALQYHRAIHAPIRLVTRSGELLDRDGRLVVGRMEAGIGIISRRTELRQVADQAQSLETVLHDQEKHSERLQNQLGERHAASKEIAQRRQQAFERATKLESRVDSAHQRVDELTASLQTSEAELNAAVASRDEVKSLLAHGRSQLSQLEGAIRLLESSLAKERSRITEMEELLQVRQLDVTEKEVVVAKSGQQLDALDAQLQQLQRSQGEREEAIQSVQTEFDRCVERRQHAELQILAARSEIAELALTDEACQEQLRAIEEQRTRLQSRRKSAQDAVGTMRQLIRKAEQRLHTHELDAEKVRHQRDSLAERLKEDYGIATDQLNAELTHDEMAEREEIDAEIQTLRQRLSKLGAVNLDALEEIDEIESRYTTLKGQYDDLIEAKETLEKIIAKINADSRRLFAETLEAIRVNFGRMFRKVFGGGRADIVLEEGVDILESGIEIIATPPGKHSLALSLLSGGERALTAVTLLMAIFEYRPSPFCVLDEVDGPLDEANIGRFVEVLRSFLQWTKFVVVTHSKRTMTAATTLYGVTMQESGVSKRVAVRFEDVSEGGEIALDAIRRTPKDGGDDDDERGAA